MRGAIILVASFVLAGLANGDENRPGWEYIDKLAKGTVDIDNREERLKLVNEMRDHIGSINSVIPNPTPEVRAWVEQEEVDALNAKTFSVERHAAWMSSKELAHVEFKDLHVSLMSWTKCVVDAPRLSHEMYCWSGFADTLGSRSCDLFDYMQRLEKHKIIPESVTAMVLTYGAWSSLIIRQIVTRYLLELDMEYVLENSSSEH